MKLQVIRGHQFQKYLHAVADLRMSIFREYPYLYDSDMQSELDYLKGYSTSKNSLLIIVQDQEKVVGALTGIPLGEMDKAFLPPFVKGHLPIRSIFYLGEMLLLKEYRGKKLGYKMYKTFEDLVKQTGQYKMIAIAEVIRDKNDPRKPKHYIPARKLWEKLGFVEHPEMIMQFSYKQVDSAGKVPNSLVFSFRELE